MLPGIESVIVVRAQKSGRSLETYLCLNQIAILQHFGEQEAFLLVDETSTSFGVDIRDLGEAHARRAGSVDPLEGVPCPILILRVAGCTVSVVDALDDLGASDVVAGADPESRLIVETSLVGGWWLVVGCIGRCVAVLPPEAFRADAGCSLEVCFMTAIGQFEPKFDIVFSIQSETAQNEVASSETID